MLAAKNGIEAVEKYKKRQDKIELVLTDLGLPILSGWEAFRQMKEIKPKVKVIIASGYLDPNAKSELLKHGAKDFVQKPYEPNEILEKIREVLDTQ